MAGILPLAGLIEGIGQLVRYSLSKRNGRQKLIVWFSATPTIDSMIPVFLLFILIDLDFVDFVFQTELFEDYADLLTIGRPRRIPIDRSVLNFTLSHVLLLTG